ncbi:MAG TPA: prepilin-type N-terminal cleavage/methylation domain-containing protein [Longimicrobium sp.]|nr:prepilin-type N-terminal cleavage/methylation domain-containing protein [Longimicrobium sp.]
MTRPDPRRAGFTLLEVVVALAVTGLVIAGAGAVLARLGDDAARLAAVAADDDREANADRLLRDLLARAEPPAQDGPRFVGDPRGVRFDTRCDVPSGWQERCEASLGVVEVNGVTTLGLTLSTGEVVVLRRGFGRAVLRYLYDPGNGGVWVSRWSSAFSLPWAVGVEVDGELAILPIGERG